MRTDSGGMDMRKCICVDIQHVHFPYLMIGWIHLIRRIAMSKNWVKDINKMHEKYGVHEWIKNNQHQLKQFLDFRLRFLYEEANETSLAVDARDAEEIAFS